jgi:hypothetical protein
MEKKRRGRRKSEVFTDVVEIVKDEAQELVNEIKEDVAEGLGDTLEKVFKKTGIKKLVKFIAGEDCGCDERKKKLNELFPYRKISCLNEDEYNVLDTYFGKNTAEIAPSDQHELLKVYNRVLNINREPTSCSSCWRDILNQLKKVYNQYKDEHDANS